MKVVLLEENRLRRVELQKALEKTGNKVTLASDSDSFIQAASAQDAELYVIDVRSWYRGESIYSYFDIASKMNGVAALFYNSPEGFVALEGRDALPTDVVLEKENAIPLIAQRVEQLM